MKEIFTQSETMSKEYCCSIVRIKELTPIANSDFLATTLVNGFQVVVRKDFVKTGDLMFYAANETELDGEFLSVNNSYDLSNIEKNANYKEVKELLSAKEKCTTEEEKEEIDKKNLDFYVFAATDILNANSKIIALGNKTNTVEKAFGVNLDNHTALLENVVSRKKQMLPNILNNLD